MRLLQTIFFVPLVILVVGATLWWSRSQSMTIIRKWAQENGYEVVSAEPRNILRGAFWFRSPHPTVYRAERDGTLTVAGKTVRFRAGDDIVFQCRMERDERREDDGPVLIARLQPTQNARLCGDMSSSMKGMGRME